MVERETAAAEDEYRYETIETYMLAGALTQPIKIYSSQNKRGDASPLRLLPCRILVSAQPGPSIPSNNSEP